MYYLTFSYWKRSAIITYHSKHCYFPSLQPNHQYTCGISLLLPRHICMIFMLLQQLWKVWSLLCTIRNASWSGCFPGPGARKKRETGPVSMAFQNKLHWTTEDVTDLCFSTVWHHVFSLNAHFTQVHKWIRKTSRPAGRSVETLAVVACNGISEAAKLGPLTPISMCHCSTL